MGREKGKADIQAHIRKKSMRMKTVNKHQDLVLENKLKLLDRLAVNKLENHLKETKTVSETLKDCNKTTGLCKSAIKPEREDSSGCLVELKTMTNPWTYFGKYTIETWENNASTALKSNPGSPNATPRPKTANPPGVGMNRAPSAIIPTDLPTRPQTVADMSNVRGSNFLTTSPRPRRKPLTIETDDRPMQRPKTTGTRRLLLKRSAKTPTIPEEKEEGGDKRVSWGYRHTDYNESSETNKDQSRTTAQIDPSAVTKRQSGVKQQPSGTIDLPQLPEHSQGSNKPAVDIVDGHSSLCNPKTHPVNRDSNPRPKTSIHRKHNSDAGNNSYPEPLNIDSSPPLPNTTSQSANPEPLDIDSNPPRPNMIRRLTSTQPTPKKKVDTPRLLTLIDPSFYDEDPARVYYPQMIKPDRPKFHVRPQDRYKAEDMFLMQRYTTLQRQMNGDGPPMNENKMKITVLLSHSARKKALHQMVEDNTQQLHQEKRRIQQSDIQTRVNSFIQSLQEFIQQQQPPKPVVDDQQAAQAEEASTSW